MTNLTNLMFRESVKNEKIDLVEFGKDILNSEDLTNHIYSCFLSMIIDKGFVGESRRTTWVSDFGSIYLIGPYIPCAKRITLIGSVDVKNDGIPGVSVTGGLNPYDKDFAVSLIRPIEKIPAEFPLIGRVIKKYKIVSIWKKDGKEWIDSSTYFFGVNRNGKIVTPYSKDWVNPIWGHAGISTFASMAINAHADSRYLWLAKTSEDIGTSDLRLRLGLDKEHIKSLFYARSLPITETGRKRPILHWVRSHNRRIKEGIEIDVSPYLKGVERVEMDGLRIEITQPKKSNYQTAESLKQAYKLYAWGAA